MRLAWLALVTLVLMLDVRSACAATFTLFDGDFPDPSWTTDGGNGEEFTIGSAGPDGNPGAYGLGRERREM